MTLHVASTFIEDVKYDDKPRCKTFTEKLLEYEENANKSPTILDRIVTEVENYIVPTSVITSAYSSAPSGRYVVVSILVYCLVSEMLKTKPSEVF